MNDDALPGAQDGSGRRQDRGRNRATSTAVMVRLLVLALLLAAAGGAAVSDHGRLLVDVNHQVAALGFWGPLAFALCYAVAETAFFPGSILTASAGALFGVALGTATVLAGATAGACLSFAVGRWLGAPVVTRFAGAERLARMEMFLRRGAFWSVLGLRLVPLFPFSFVNYAAGAAGVRFIPYLAATAVGIVPGTFLYAGLGGSLRAPGSPVLWIALTGLLALSLGGGWAARRIRSRRGPAVASTGADGTCPSFEDR